MSERLFNHVYYALRSRVRWTRPTYNPPNEDKKSLFEPRPTLLPTADRLEGQYRLINFREKSTTNEFRESLYVLELMDRFFPILALSETVRSLDVGSKNFAYARGLYHFFRNAGGNIRQVELTGIEVDAYQIYSNLHSRYDYALYHTRSLDRCRFIPGDVLEHQERYDVITWFLPFVTKYPLRKWGLPGSLFKPVDLLKHVYGLLKEGGILLIANKEEKERDIQLDLLRHLRIPFQLPERFEPEWIAYAPRYVVVIQKPSQ